MASTQQIRLSPTMFMEVSEKEIQFSRKRGLFFRMVNVPRYIFELSAKYDRAFDSLNDNCQEKHLVSRDGWQVSVVSFKGKNYMAYTRINQKGERVNWLSMNLEEADFYAARNYLCGFDNTEWEDTVDMAEGCNEGKLMDVFYGILEDVKTGIQRICTERYLDRGACELATYAKTEPGKIEKVVIKSESILVPSSNALLKDVYHYMLHSKFDAIVCENCYGCINNRPGQKDHMQLGCLEDKNVLINLYGKPCYEKVTSARLLNALNVMCKEYKVVNDQTLESVKNFASNVNYEDVLMSTRTFVYEFGKLTGL